MTKEFYKKLIWISLFAIAMGYLETAVVVYLRKLYYPGGFNFPLKTIESSIGVVEFFREIATIVMLIGAGVIAGKTRNEKFAWFIFCFAVWDIFYYVFLKVLLGWPHSLVDWDILFLIPVPWVGPVLAPCIIALTMILLAMIIVVHEEQGRKTRIDWVAKSLMTAGALVCIVSFCWDYINNANEAGRMWTVNSSDDLFREIDKYIPRQFNWGLFMIGETIGLAGVLRIFNFSKRAQSPNLLKMFKQKISG
ncbi:MAG: hypothetical protein IAF38_10045 [Bacteroidia bacterium]|nr:hypothetical protein [Bacteroidia bacterium]